MYNKYYKLALCKSADFNKLKFVPYTVINKSDKVWLAWLYSTDLKTVLARNV